MSMRHTATVTVDNLRITYTYAKGYRVSYRPRGEGWTKIAWFAFSQDLLAWARSEGYDNDAWRVAKEVHDKAVDLVNHNREVFLAEHAAENS